ncbi:MAG: hypothetical protein HY720_19495 [Planctomycetes bacterium]|nr:hypothetical protein [Planctomycetota bacterium]
MSRHIVLAALLALAAGCSIGDRWDGVPNRWQREKQSFQPGATTQADVLARLGPPSQVLALGERTVFYYLLEHERSETLNLILYSQTKAHARYDRAIFFFDREGRLAEFATSAIPLLMEEEKAEEGGG